jgi:hypothetical protein
MCHQSKFKSVGWTNVSVWGFVVAMLGSLVVFISAFKVEIPCPAAENNMNGRALEMEITDRLVIEILGVWMWRAGNGLPSWVRRGSIYIDRG